MKYIQQMAILFLICVLGDLLSALIGHKLPGNVLGLSLLFVLLAAGLVKLNHIEQAADFLIANMAFLFLPSCIGILDVFPQIKNQLFPIIAVILCTTLITAATTAWTVHGVLRLQARFSTDKEGNSC